MKIVDAEWTEAAIMLAIECGCGHQFKQRADRWRVVCLECRDVANLANLRDQYVEEQDGGA